MGVKATYLALINIDEVARDLESSLDAQRLDAGAALRLCEMHRRRACGLLLTDVDAAAFRSHLRVSARQYLQILGCRDAGQQLDPYYMTRARATPLIDALAAGDHDLAQQIAAALPDEWVPDLEPAEDSSYIGAIAALTLESPDTDSRVETLDGVSSGGAQLGVVRSLAARDAGQFAEALTVATEEWREEIQKLRSGERLDPYDDATTANIFVEGVGLVQLARTLGVATERQYAFIPDVALD